MHLSKIQIQNIKSLKDVMWELEGAERAGWHVILGDNGAGKTSFVRSVALALVGVDEAKALRQNWNDWLRKEQDAGIVSLTVEGEEEYDESLANIYPYSDVMIEFHRNTEESVSIERQNRLKDRSVFIERDVRRESVEEYIRRSVARIFGAKSLQERDDFARKTWEMLRTAYLHYIYAIVDGHIWQKEDIDDVCIDIWLDALESLKEHPEKWMQPRLYLAVIAMRHCLRWRRREAIRQKREVEMPSTEEEFFATDEDYFVQERELLTPEEASSDTSSRISFFIEDCLWGDESGWFSASYGPFRRFSGSNEDDGKMFQSNPKLAPHLSAFGESIALTEGIEWLKQLKFQAFEEPNGSESKILAKIIAFLNQPGFLPNKAYLKGVSSRGVHFVDGNGCDIEADGLSDGYRSILSMTFELIRQMVRAFEYLHIFSEDGTKIIVPGVVLIDEVDAHLHPSWQRRIGYWFRKHFPNIQFIVTTHSPLVCQAASVGTVFRLPAPGSDETGGFITGTDLQRLLYGNVLEAYSTEAFGFSVTRSEESRQKLERLAELNVAEMRRELTAEEYDEQESLRATFPTTAHTLVGTDGK